MVTVTKSGGQTVTKVDDGTNTTRITEMNGQTIIRVTNDATHKVVSGYVGSDSNISVGGGQGPHVTVSKHGPETTTTVDNGTNTAIVDDQNGKSTVSVTGEGAGIGGMLANLEKLMQAQRAARASSTAAAAAPATTTPVAGAAPAASGGTTAAAGAAGTAPTAPVAAGTASTTPTSGQTTTSAAGTSSTSGSSASASSSATPADLASLMALSPDQFMQAVTSGKIPDDVANSQSAMMQVQARMNQITQMNQLVTGMMAAMHQMEMSIIQNIRC